MTILRVQGTFRRVSCPSYCTSPRPEQLDEAIDLEGDVVFGGRDARLSMVTMFAILERLSVALASVAITSGASLAIRLYLTRRMIRR